MTGASEDATDHSRPLSAANFRVSANGALGAGGWSQYESSCVIGICQMAWATARPHFVSVVWPDGHTEIFDFTPWTRARNQGTRAELSQRPPVGSRRAIITTWGGGPRSAASWRLEQTAAQLPYLPRR